MCKSIINNSFYLLLLILFFSILYNHSFAQTVSDTTKAATDTSAKPSVDVEKFFKENPDTLTPKSPPPEATPALTAEDVEKFFSDTLPKKDTLGNLPSSATTSDTSSISPTPTAVTPATPLQGEKEKETSGEVSSLNATDTSQKEKRNNHEIIDMRFVKQRVQHSPDSTFFNILKITNNNAHPVDGVVRISVPAGWKIISEEETVVNIPVGETQYVPIRVSMARNASGGTSYVINATLISNRSLFSDKNQNTLSKPCYITIPKKTQWDIYPVYRTVHVNRYSEYTPFQLKLSNKGNGSETIKLEFSIGSSLEMYGAIGRKYFTSLEIKPHRDTIISFQVKYHPLDESALWNRDFQSSYIKIIATSDSITKRTSVNFKHLESVYYNELADKQTPLTIDLQLQNLLSTVVPRIVFGAQGTLVFKNFNTLDYYLSIPGLLLSYKNTNIDIGNSLLYQTRFRVKYSTDKWSVMAGDVSSSGINLLGIGGRGIGGTYQINKNHTVSAAVFAAQASPVYSGNVEHVMRLKRIGLAYNLSFIADNYNKINSYGLFTKVSYPFMSGHIISLILAATQTQHLYNNQTFTDAQGNYIITNDPNTTFYGFGSQLQYNFNHKKARAVLNATYTSPHFSQYNNGRIQVSGNGQYFFNQKYYLTGNANIYQYDPKLYYRGILYPERKFLSGSYLTELADKINQRLTLFAGPHFEHLSSEVLKITSTKDSIRSRFSSFSPRLSFRLNYKSHINSSVTPSLLFGYTYITSAQDSFLGKPVSSVKNEFFNARLGLNVLQKDWGVNIQYFYGPHNISNQTTYYYYRTFTKTIRISPYFQKYYFNRTLLISSYNSYYYDVGSRSNYERIVLNARLTFFLNKGWTFYTDNTLFLSNNINSEGIRISNKNYYLGIGVKKIFDIPQPGYKYYDLKIICFKDINGNNIMDDNEHGLSDVVITIDRRAIIDSVTKKPFRMHGHFSPAELVTDNFGQIIYYRIPSGEYDLNIYPLFNLKDLYNINGQKQQIRITSDTTYYIPFAQSFKIIGHIILNRDEYSSFGMVSPANVRVVATNDKGNSFFALTANDGSYALYVPQAGEYKVTVNNIFGEQFVLQEPEYTLSFDGAKEFQVDFIFNEKRRIINVEGKPTTIEELLVKKPSNYIFVVPPDTIKKIDSVITVRRDTIKGIDSVIITKIVHDTVYLSQPKDTALNGATSIPGKPNTYYYSIPVGPSITYRVQIAASANRIPTSKYPTRFKGLSSIFEYYEDGLYKYAAGNFTNIEDARKFKDTLRSKGYKDAFIVPFYENKRLKYKGK